MRGTFSTWFSGYWPKKRCGQFPAWRCQPVVWNVLGLLIFWPLLTSPASAGIDDAIASALQTARAYTNQGYIIHEEDEWGGDLGIKESKAILHTLVHGNDYWFCIGTDVENARISIHVYNGRGQLVEVNAWQDGSHAAAETVNPATATYYIVVEVTASPTVRTHWAMIYGSKPVSGRRPR